MVQLPAISYLWNILRISSKTQPSFPTLPAVFKFIENTLKIHLYKNQLHYLQYRGCSTKSRVQPPGRESQPDWQKREDEEAENSSRIVDAAIRDKNHKELRRLHNCQLTEADRDEDWKLNESIQNLPEEDTFGQMTEAKKIHKFGKSSNQKNFNRTWGRSEKWNVFQNELSFSNNRHASISSQFKSSKEKSFLNADLVDFQHTPKKENTLFKVQRKKKYKPSVTIDCDGEANVKVKYNKWTEKFGTLVEENNKTMIESDNFRYQDDEKDGDDDSYSFLRLSRVNRAHEPLWYARQIKKLGKEGKVKEAINVLEDWMLKRDRVMPTPYEFNLLISILGRAGYTKKAFQLFNKMKKMGLQPRDHTYTALFNACSNSPWTSDGLSRAMKLHALMKEKSVQPNFITYKALLKTYGVCGDLHAAFRLMDEIVKDNKPDQECFSFLLMACISDKEAGMKLAIQVWRRMLKLKLKPDRPLYNLLLRAVRDCRLGDDFCRQDVLEDENPVSQGYKCLIDGNLGLAAQQYEEQDLAEFFSKSQKTNAGNQDEESQQPSAPDVTSSTVHLSPVNVSVSDPFCSVFDLNQTAKTLSHLNRSEERLALIGGHMGILKNMEQNEVQPDIRTLTQLVDCLPPSARMEIEILEWMKHKDVKPDIDLFNMIIRKRNIRGDFQGAKEILSMITNYHLYPNQRTFGCLAMGCSKMANGLQLLQDMENAGLEPNVETIGILVYQSGTNFQYKLALIKEMERLMMEPNAKLLEHIENSVAKAKFFTVQREKQRPVKEYYRSAHFQDHFRKFMFYYKPWLLRTRYQKLSHPWSPFQNPPDNGK